MTGYRDTVYRLNHTKAPRPSSLSAKRLEIELIPSQKYHNKDLTTNYPVTIELLCNGLNSTELLCRPTICHTSTKVSQQRNLTDEGR